MTKEKPEVYIERVAKLDKEGIRAVCGTEEEYSNYVNKMTKEKEICETCGFTKLMHTKEGLESIGFKEDSKEVMGVCKEFKLKKEIIKEALPKSAFPDYPPKNKFEKATLADKKMYQMGDEELDDENMVYPEEDVKEKLQNVQRRLKEELKQTMYGEIDWIQVFKDAYESRRTSWHEVGNIQEWRNATDEVLFAVWKQLEKKFNIDKIFDEEIGEELLK